MDKTKIGIVGHGYVGRAMNKFLGQKYPVWVYDPAEIHGRNHFEDDILDAEQREAINKCDIVFICVPTPFAEDGSCNTDIVESSVAWIEAPLLCIKSTVPPGTTERLKDKYNKRIVFSPEFCGESDYNTGHSFTNTVANEPFFIFGGWKNDTTQLVDLVSRIAGPTKKYFQCTAKEAETIKYFENTALGVKVVLAYEFHQICMALGVDWNTVREGWLLDPRMGTSHTSVFKDNNEPFGGKCLPKDITALTKFSEKAGYKAQFIEDLLKSNRRIGLTRQFGVK